MLRLRKAYLYQRRRRDRQTRAFEYAAEVQGPASSNLPGLAELLDCSSLKDQAAIDGRFNLIARSLLCDHVGS